jgi:hypothetical protein
MAGGMDPIVKNFVKHRKDKKVMVLTTSGDGGWLPKMKDQDFDAIATASEKDKTAPVAQKIITTIKNSF